MNAPIKFAQASTQADDKDPKKEVKVVKITKPADGQAITIELSYDQSIKVDFSAIADERIIIVRTGERAVILFDNGATVTLDPFFDSLRRPLANLEFEFGPGKVLTAAELAGLVPFTDDQSVLPAAGEGGTPREAGANFNPHAVEGIGPVVLNELMPPEELGPIQFRADIAPAISEIIFSLLLSVDGGEVDEDELPAGLKDSAPGDNDGPDSFTKPINVDWGGDTGAGRTIYFSATPVVLVVDQAGNDITATLTSGGQPVQFLPLNPQLLVGYIGAPPADENAANVVFVVEIDLTNINSPSYIFTLKLPLDHPFWDEDLLNDGPDTAYEDDIIFTFSITAQNSQGTTATATFSVLVDDDSPVAIDEQVAKHTLNENDIKTILSLGTSPFDGTGDGSDTGPFTFPLGWPASIEGDVSGYVDFGADGPAAGGGFSFSSDALTELSDLGLLSKSGTVKYALFGNTIVAFVDVGAQNDVFNFGDRLIFTFTLNPDGTWQMRLFDQLDHVAPPPGTADENFDLIANGGSISEIDFGSIIVATDYDGDSVTLDGILPVEIRDDIPFAKLFASHHKVAIDESAGNQQNDTTFASVVNLFNGVANKGTDADMPAPQYARNHIAAQVIFGSFPGADEPTTSTLSLAIAGGDGVDSGLKTTEGDTIYLFIENGIIVGRIDGNGDGIDKDNLQSDDLAAFALHLDSFGRISIAQWMSIFHTDPNHPNDYETLDGKIEVVFTVTDYDGDSVVKVVNIGDNIRFYDDAPTIVSRQPVKITVDEGDILTFWSQGTTPNDGNADGSFTGQPPSLFGPAYVSGSLTSLIDFGADGPGGFSFTSDALTALGDLGLRSKGSALNFDIVGNSIVASVGFGFSYRPVFSLTLNPDGTFEFRQFDQLDHVAPASGADKNFTLVSTIPGLDAIDFGMIIQATDGDGDSVSLDGLFLVEIRDDIPTLKHHAKVFGVVEEEQLPFGNEDTTSGPPDLDNDQFWNFNITTNVFVGTGGNSLATLVNVGADENGKFTFKSGIEEGDAIKDKDGDDVKSKGVAVTVKSVTSGSDGGGAFQLLTAWNDTNDVFTLKIYENGNWRFELLAQLDHHLPQNADNQEGILSLDFAGLVQFTDFDGDSIDLDGAQFYVKVIDDIPTLKHLKTSGAVVQHDETPGIQNPGDGDDDVLYASLPAAIQNLFDGVANPGNDPDVDPKDGPFGEEKAIGYASSGGSMVTFNASVGADQPGSIGYALVLGGPDNFSGLYTTDDKPIYLFKEGDVIVGRYDPAGGVADGQDPAAFAIAIGGDGSVYLVQWVSLQHPTGGASHDEGVVIAHGRVRVEVTVTDEDGDKTTGTIDISRKIQFDDDGPSADDVRASAILDDEGLHTVVNPGPDAEGIPGGPGDEAGEATTVSGNLGFNAGSDGLKSVKVNGVTANGGALWAVVIDTATGQGTPMAVTTQWVESGAAGTLYGFVEQGGTPGEYDAGTDYLVFTLKVQPNGNYTLTMHAPLAHPLTNDPATEETETEYEDELTLVFDYTVTDGDNDTADGSLTVIVDDDTPDVDGTEDISVDAGDDTQQFAALGFKPGADGWSYANLFGNEPPEGLTSNDQPVLYWFNEDGTVLIAYTGTPVPDGGAGPAEANQVFKVTIDPVTNQWSFQILGTIDGAEGQTLPIGGSTSYGAGPAEAQILTTGSGGTGVAVSVVTGWNATGIDVANWQATGNAGAITPADVNGSTSGWGVAPGNTFEGSDFFRFDFGDEDFSASGFNGPNVSSAKFQFSNLSGGPSTTHTIPFVVHYTDGPPFFEAGNIVFDGNNYIWEFTAPSGKLIDYVEFYANGETGGPKVSLIEVGAFVEGNEVHLAFQANLADGDGDVEQVSLAVTLAPQDPPLTARSFEGAVEEENLQPGTTQFAYPVTQTGNEDIHDKDGLDTDTEGPFVDDITNVKSGTLDASGGNGGPYTFSLNVTDDAPVGLAGGGTLQSGGQNVLWHQVDASNAIGYVNTDGTEGYQPGDQVVFSLNLTGNAWTFTLLHNVDHPEQTDGGPFVNGEGTEENIEIDLGSVFSVTDGIQTAPVSGSVKIIDDVPEAADDNHEVEAGAQKGIDLLLVVDISGSMGTIVPDTGGKTRLDLAREALLQLVNNPEVDEVKIVQFRGSARTTVWLTKAQAIAFINDNAQWDNSGLSSGTNYDAALFGANGATSAFTTAPSSDDFRYVFFLSDGEPNGPAGSIGINATEEGNWITFLANNNIVKSVAVGFGDLNATNANQLEPIAWEPGETAGSKTTAAADDNVIIINDNDLSDLGDVLEGALNTADGNVLANDPGFGADGGYIKSIVVNGTTYEFDGVNTITTSGVPAPGGFENHNTWILVPTALGGTLIFYFADTGGNDAGDWSYTPPAALPGGGNESFAYTLIDGDGDTASANLNIEVLEPANQPPVGVTDNLYINGPSGVSVTLQNSWLVRNDTDGDGDPLNVASVASGPNVTAGAVTATTTTITYNGVSNTTGSFTYVATDGTDNSAPTTVNVIRGTNSSIVGGAGNDILIDTRGNETTTLDGGAGSDIIIAGQGNDIIIADQNDFLIDGGSGNDTLNVGTNFTSTSDDQIVNIENVTLTALGLTLNLSNQTEGFTVNGMTGNDTIITGSGNDIINSNGGSDTIVAGAGGDRVNISGSVANTTTTVDLGVDSATDKVVFSHGTIGNTHNTVAIVSNFNVAHDRVAVVLNGTSLTDGGFQTVTANQTNISAGVEVIELVNASFVTSSLTDDSNNGAIEQIIQEATNNFPATGNYTFIVYSDTTGTAHAGIYSVEISDSTNPNQDGMVVEHIMTLTGVGYGNLTAANFVGTADPIVLDLGAPGISFSGTEDGVQFDMNGDGQKQQTAWTNGEDGLLVMDLDGSGAIESGNEIVSPYFNGGGFENSVQALASLDENGDGLIDRNDAAYGQLRVWIDADQDGVSQEGELLTLDELGIESINVNAESVSYLIDGQQVFAEGSFTTTSGETRAYVGVEFETTDVGAVQQALAQIENPQQPV